MILIIQSSMTYWYLDKTILNLTWLMIYFESFWRAIINTSFHIFKNQLSNNDSYATKEHFVNIEKRSSISPFMCIQWPWTMSRQRRIKNILFMSSPYWITNISSIGSKSENKSRRMKIKDRDRLFSQTWFKKWHFAWCS